MPNLCRAFSIPRLLRPQPQHRNDSNNSNPNLSQFQAQRRQRHGYSCPRNDQSSSSILPITTPTSSPQPLFYSPSQSTTSPEFPSFPINLSQSLSTITSSTNKFFNELRLKSRITSTLSITTFLCLLTFTSVSFYCYHTYHYTYIISKSQSKSSYNTHSIPLIISKTKAFINRLYYTAVTYDWRGNASFYVTNAMKVSIAFSMTIGTILGVAVGLISGLEPAVVIGVSASMAMGCVFVMSFAVLQGVNPLRAIAFALFVSICLPFGFGFGFGFGVLLGVACGLEDPDEIREKTSDFIYNFSDFVRVVAAFTLEIL